MPQTQKPTQTVKQSTREIGDLDPSWIQAKIPDGYTVVAVGDIIMEHAIRAQLALKGSQSLIDLLGTGDLVVGNFEGSILDLRKFDGYAEAQSGFGWLISAPECAHDLRSLGVHMLSRANNHTLDWGVEGMRMTDGLLVDAGLAVAGTGESMTAARAPAYFDGSKARASLVSLTTTFEPNLPANDALGQLAARPGANTLGTTAIALVSEARLEALRDIRDALLPGTIPDVLLEVDRRLGVVSLFGKTYKAYPAGAPDTSIVRNHYTMDTNDLANIILNVRQAKQTSDFHVLACHTHEPSNWIETTPNFLPDLARTAIDNGADMVCGHGPHQLRGIEIYKGKPIFYSLANFCFMENVRGVIPRDEWERRGWAQLDNLPSLDPARMTSAEFMEWQRVRTVFAEKKWFESVVPVTKFNNRGHVDSIRLVPIEMRWTGRDAERGLPAIAKGTDAIAILKQLQRLSEPFGTKIEVRNDEGFIELN